MCWFSGGRKIAHLRCSLTDVCPIQCLVAVSIRSVHNHALSIESQNVLRTIWQTISQRISLSSSDLTLPTEEVRPVSISCLCRKSFCRATPRPSSRTPWVKTPNRVDLPASTLPVTATLNDRGKDSIEYPKWVIALSLPHFHEVLLIDVSSNQIFVDETSIVGHWFLS